jgi:hypothetical protein
LHRRGPKASPCKETGISAKSGGINLQNATIGEAKPTARFTTFLAAHFLLMDVKIIYWIIFRWEYLSTKKVSL